MVNFTAPNIKFSGEDLSEGTEIIRNLKFLYSIIAGTYPMDRQFGLEADFMDLPELTAKNMIALEIIEKTAQFEPRATVESVEFEHGPDGALYPIVTVGRSEEGEEEWQNY